MVSDISGAGVLHDVIRLIGFVPGTDVLTLVFDRLVETFRQAIAATTQVGNDAVRDLCGGHWVPLRDVDLRDVDKDDLSIRDLIF